MKRIIVNFIPHELQRYPSCGDWTVKDGVLTVNVSQLPSGEAAELCLAHHEITEAMCCHREGVTDKMVDEFDFKFEQNDANRKTPGGDEPGDEPKAPYHRQHSIATAFERILAERWGLNWKEKEAELYALPYPEHWEPPKTQ